jgi:mRNA interferase MazF
MSSAATATRSSSKRTNSATCATLVAPTSASAMPATFRPVIDLDGTETRVLVEQTTVVDPQRLGRSAGRLDPDELRALDQALSLLLGL